MSSRRTQRRVFVPPQDEIGLELEGQAFTPVEGVEIEEIDEAPQINQSAGAAIEIPANYGQLDEDTTIEVQRFKDFDNPNDSDDDPDYDVNEDLHQTRKTQRRVEALDSLEVEECSICGTTVADLALHIVNRHSSAPAKPTAKPMIKGDSTHKPQASSARPAPKIYSVGDKRPMSPSAAMLAVMPRKRAYTKGKYQQIKPVLRYPCDACKHVSKTTDQLKKHMIVVHNGHKHTTWMFCGDCDYATRVEEELVNHVKHHQLFKILGDDEDNDEIMCDTKKDNKNNAKSKSGLGNYSSFPMDCGDCSFSTHYEDQLFEHLKAHLRKDCNVSEENEAEIEVKKEEIEASVEQRTIYEEDGFLHCGLCTFSSKSNKNMLRHSNVAHGIVINDKDYQGGTTIAVKQTAYHCTLCKFRGVDREELAAHRKRTIHNKYGGVTAVDPIAEAEERKARIRNNCLQ